MSSKFRPKPAHFEKKSQIVPNSLIFHKHLSDSAIRLMCALNACPESWTIIQSDIQQRLGWGRERMRSAIKECIEHGYLKITQSRRANTEREKNGGFKKGQFSHNEFEFDIEGGYSKNDQEIPYEECPDNEYEPERAKPSSAKLATATNPLPCSLDNTLLKEKKETQDFLSSFNSEDQKKIDFLSPFDLEESYLSVLIAYDYDRIVLGVQGALQWKKRREDKGESIDGLGGAFVKFVTQGWKPYKTQEDIGAEKSQIIADKEAKITERRQQAKELEELWASVLPFQYSFKVLDRYIDLKLGNRMGTLELNDEDSIQSLKRHIERYKNIIDINKL